MIALCALAHSLSQPRLTRYDVNGFLEKNKDPISPDLTKLLEGSTSQLGATLFASSGSSGSAGGGRERGLSSARKPTARTTLGSQFRTQLGKLMDTLKATEPHFVRCIKPNTNKSSKEFAAPMCLEQLRCVGAERALQCDCPMAPK